MAKPIRNVLDTFLKTNNSWKAQLLQDWPKIIGKLQDKVSIEKVQDATLILSVADACWLQELYLLSPVLLKTINQKLDRPRIKRLRFKQAGIKEKKKKAVVQKKRPIKKPKPLSKKELDALKKIDDAQLSSVLEQFLQRCHQEQE